VIATAALLATLAVKIHLALRTPCTGWECLGTDLVAAIPLALAPLLMVATLVIAKVPRAWAITATATVLMLSAVTLQMHLGLWPSQTTLLSVVLAAASAALAYTLILELTYGWTVPVALVVTYFVLNATNSWLAQRESRRDSLEQIEQVEVVGFLPSLPGYRPVGVISDQEKISLIYESPTSPADPNLIVELHPALGRSVCAALDQPLSGCREHGAEGRFDRDYAVALLRSGTVIYAFLEIRRASEQPLSAEAALAAFREAPRVTPSELADLG
jgi:hypothetical protein